MHSATGVRSNVDCSAFYPEEPTLPATQLDPVRLRGTVTVAVVDALQKRSPSSEVVGQAMEDVVALAVTTTLQKDVDDHFAPPTFVGSGLPSSPPTSALDAPMIGKSDDAVPDLSTQNKPDLLDSTTLTKRIPLRTVLAAGEQPDRSTRATLMRHDVPTGQGPPV